MDKMQLEKVVDIRGQKLQSDDQAATAELEPESEWSEVNRRLGWQRPAEFKSTWIEFCFVLSSVGALSMADFIIDGFPVILPALVEPFNIPSGSQIWPSSVVTMVAGSFLFPLGRLTDMYGGYYIFNGGLVWFTLWTLAAGFANSFVFLVFCRAMQGLGLSAFLPAGIALLGRFYRPGPRKNLIFALYGASCPLGLFGGMLTAGLAQQVFDQWRWFFWIGGAATGLCCVGTVINSPRDVVPADGRTGQRVTMDWPGTLTTVPGFMLVLYAAAKGTNSDNGFASPHVLISLLLGLAFLALAVYVEGKVESPMIPADIFQVKYMKPMLLYLLFSWGVYSMYQFYTNFYIQIVMGKSSLTTALWYAPWAAAGLLLSTLGGVVLDRIPACWLLIPSSISTIMAVLLFALMPTDPNYWAWIFPAMIFEAASADILWTVSNVFLTTSLPRHHQGLAGAIISMTLFMGDALFLAVGDVVEERLAQAGADANTQYKGVFWIAVVIGVVAILINAFIRIPRATAELTSEEKDDMMIDRVSWRRESSVSVTDSETVLGSEAEGLLGEPSEESL
ncbi:hypothetical protein L249_2035 [Ophiocordyceps polyrhachis-furcata BCC 54312]|uniref:Major facilitator superfamily (MFS) profile domain-containing protein n=1 Tax=Ophiocordyceps polyrhachis-furcata BCC 54312 TaxID=1330021 RepID=A0A367LND6_9HYPO|nr:hypothetical protein L249_2035 [Ophiocordyceps polyrhachis-furcata BCC 54312]